MLSHLPEFSLQKLWNKQYPLADYTLCMYHAIPIKH
ncbi:hypothetical protein SAMN04488691_1104 [Haloferax larsenii]|uniref:Uncharacterized protein n=1 Tax=Haloferax larsenii TaxID=302484 RepID=A0A1H7TPF7_HALLR|nr:hypothetical protein SAMN04488691_1104 [Haloferax larsenii]